MNASISSVGGGQGCWEFFCMSQELVKLQGVSFANDHNLISTQCLGERGTKHWADESDPHASLPAVPPPRGMCAHTARVHMRRHTHRDTC